MVPKNRSQENYARKLKYIKSKGLFSNYFLEKFFVF